MSLEKEDNWSNPSDIPNVTAAVSNSGHVCCNSHTELHRLKLPQLLHTTTKV